MRFYAFWVFIVASIPFMLRNPFYGLVLYCCMNIIRPELLFWGGHETSWNSMPLVALATLLGVLFNAGKLNFNRLFNFELLLVFLLYLGVVLSIVFSNYILDRQYYYANEILKIGIICSLIILLLDTPPKIILFERWLLFCIVFLAIWGIEQNFRGNYRLELVGGYDSNGIASVFVLFVPLSISQAFCSTTSRNKIIWYAASLLMILAIIFTVSRGGLLGLLAGISFYLLKSEKKKQLIIVIFIGLCVSMLFISENYTARMTSMTTADKIQDEGSAMSRIYLWQAGLMIFMDNPILGTGLLSFPQEKFQYEDRFLHLDPVFHEWIFRRDVPKVTHNTYIKYMSECGLAAAIPFFLLYLSTIQKNRRVRKSEISTPDNKELLSLLNGIECGIIGNGVCNFFIDANFMIFFYIQIIVCVSIRGILFSEKTQP